jgi:hypothetical protein
MSEIPKMSELPKVTPASQAPPRDVRVVGDDEPTAWTGYVLFAAIMLVLVGSFQGIMGLVALFEDGYYLVPGTRLVVHVDYTTWGWIHLILGLVAIAAGIGIIAGQTWARILGVILAVLSAITNVAFLAAYPVWSIMVIALDVIAIYALIVHGRKLAD